MAANRANWLYKQLNEWEQSLRKMAARRKPQQNRAWYVQDLWVEGVPYRLLDVQRERAELAAKRELLKTCLDVQAHPDALTKPAVRAKLLKDVFEVLAIPFGRHAG